MSKCMTDGFRDGSVLVVFFPMPNAFCLTLTVFDFHSLDPLTWDGRGVVRPQVDGELAWVRYPAADGFILGAPRSQ